MHSMMVWTNGVCLSLFCLLEGYVGRFCGSKPPHTHNAEQLRWIACRRIHPTVLPLLFAGLLLGSVNAMAATCNSPTGSSNWSTTVWTCGHVPLNTDDVHVVNNATVTVDITGAVAKSLTVDTGNTASRLQFNANTDLTVTNDVAVNAPTGGVTKQITVGSATLTVTTGNVIVTGGNANNAISQITVTSGSINVNTGNLTITGGAANNAIGQVTVTTGSLTVQGNAILTGGTTASRKANLTLSSTGSITLNGGLTTVSTVATSSNVAITSTGTITVSGAAGVTNGDTVTVGTGTFKVTNTSATFTNNNTAILANTTISTGLLSIAGNLVNGSTGTNTTADTITISSTGTVTVDGTLTNNQGTTVSGRITTTTTGTINANGTFLNNGVFTHSAAGKLNLRGATATMNGTFTRTTTTGTVTSNRTATDAQTLSGTALAFSNFVMNSANGVTLGNNATVNTVLTLTSGIIDTTSSLTLTTAASCATPSVTRTSGWVNGNLKKAIPAGASTCTFEIGDASNYTPVATAFVAGTGAGNLTISTTGGDHPSIASSGIDSTKSVNRFWTLTNGGVTLPGAGFTATFSYINGSPVDFDTGATPANFIVEQWNGTGWLPTTLNASCTATPGTSLCEQINGETGFGDFAIGEPVTGFNGNPGAFNAFETTMPVGVLGRIYTKIVGSAIPLSIVAVSNNGVNSAPANTALTVDVIDASSTGGTLTTSSNCRTTWTTVIQTQTVTAPGWASGRINVTITAPTQAVPNARIRITQGARIGCSTDDFAVRPQSFTVASTTVNADGTGTSTTATPIIKAGTNFSLTATAVAGYNGTPTLDVGNKVVDHNSAAQSNKLAGSFGAADPVTGIAAGSSFTYGEVGYFLLNADGVYDDAFTAVDPSGTDCTADFSNNLVGGMYGCKFGNTAATSYFGRFIPDHFDVTVNSNGTMASACSSGGFTYTGQSMTYGTAPSLTIKPMNATTGGSVTQNYSGSFQKLTASGVAITSPTADGAQNGIDGATKTALSASMTAGTLTNSSGTLTYTLNVRDPLDTLDTFDTFTYTRNTNALIGAYTSNIPLVVSTISDDEVSATGTLPTLSPTGVSLRYGRLNLSNAYGSELLSLSIPVEAQYWNGNYYTINTSDSCTSFPASSIIMGNYLSNLNACETLLSPTGTLTLSSGAINSNLSAPGSGNAGSVDLTLNIGSSASGNTCIAATESSATATNMPWFGATNPSARATFGIYQGNKHFIYFREVY